MKKPNPKVNDDDEEEEVLPDEADPLTALPNHAPERNNDPTLGDKMFGAGRGAVQGLVIGGAVVAGGFLAIGLMPMVGPIAGGIFAANMGAGLVAGSAMSVTQSFAMTAGTYYVSAAVGGGIGGIWGYASAGKAGGGNNLDQNGIPDLGGPIDGAGPTIDAPNTPNDSANDNGEARDRGVSNGEGNQAPEDHNNDGANAVPGESTEAANMYGSLFEPKP